MSIAPPRSLHNHIDGEDVDPVDDAWLDDVNPATGELLWRIPRSQRADVDAAVQAARRAQPSWGDASVAERADLCDALADAIEGRLEEFAYLESQDSGKTVRTAMDIDIPRAVRNFRFFAGAARHDETGAHEMIGAINYTVRRPVGVIGLITPWNLPLYLLTWKTAPAIAMGNAVVAKPSEMTPATASALASLFREVGAPRGVFNLVHGLGAEAGQALVEHPDVRALSFTGGTATRAHRVAGRLDVGMVWVNTWLLRDLRVPFGGVKESGFGREGGRHSLEFFSESRNICIKL